MKYLHRQPKKNKSLFKFPLEDFEYIITIVVCVSIILAVLLLLGFYNNSFVQSVENEEDIQNSISTTQTTINTNTDSTVTSFTTSTEETASTTSTTQTTTVLETSSTTKTAKQTTSTIVEINPSTTTQTVTTTIPAETETVNTQTVANYTDYVEEWTGPILTPSAGTIQGPSGKETYYNLDMSGVVSAMIVKGYNYEYWVRDDGVKMFGSYVMCAANLDLRPKGTLVQTSLGMGIVCDTGGFAHSNTTQIDIAVNW